LCLFGLSGVGEKMRLFKCQACGLLLYFENTQCERCGRMLGYLPEMGTLSALEPAGTAWTALAAPGGLHRFCANAAHDACNWLVADRAETPFCRACRHNRIIPDLTQDDNLTRWRKVEVAKHRLFFSLLRLRLPLATLAEDPEHGLAFDILADPPDVRAPKVMTGYGNGVITIALKESDDAERERMRQEMDEPYRTLLGHFRHEIGHHFWDLLVRDGGYLDAFRARFGDERQDYAWALQNHYRKGPRPGWRDSFVSAYASVHPWEDFAETWAHYLHIVDTLEVASAFGVRVYPRIADNRDLSADLAFDPYLAGSIEQLVEAWLPLSFAVNSINRSMGQPDLYPFVLSPATIGKLGFIHAVVRGSRLTRGISGQLG